MRRVLALALAMPMLAIGTPAAAVDRDTWFVAARAGSGGDGSHTHPLSALRAAERRSAPGDTIVVLSRRGVLDGGIRLQRGQRLIGEGPRARITNTTTRLGGDAVRLADHSAVRGLHIADVRRGAVYGLDVTGVRVVGNDIAGQNTSCAKGFLIPEFQAPTSVPGVGIPISGGLQNGWAAIMLDAHRRTGLTAYVARNRVHNAECGDGIDVRISGRAQARVRIVGNRVHSLRQGPDFKSVLAIGLQTRDHGQLHAVVHRNTQADLGNPDDLDLGPEGADSEGVFVNGVGPSRLFARVTRNRYTNVDGIGGFSANGLEMVTMGRGTQVTTIVRHSSFAGSPGDVIEQGALGTDARLRMVLDHVVAARSTGIGDTTVLPFNNGDCVLAGSLGARNDIDLTVRDSTMSGCSNNGLSLGSNVVNGSGPTRRLRLLVERTRITGNSGGNLGIRNFTALGRLDVVVRNSNLAGSPGRGSAVADVSVQDLGSTRRSRVDLDGGNCVAGPPAVDVIGYDVSMRRAWWGRPRGPALGSTLVLDGSLDTRSPLARRPAHC